MDTLDETVMSARSSMCINPTTLDHALVRKGGIGTIDGGPVVVIEFCGFSMQTYECDPVAVADAFERIADRIRGAIR